MSADIVYPTGYEVAWEKWIDPYDQEMEEDKMADLEDEMINDLDEMDLDDELFSEMPHKLFSPPIKAMMTAFGFIPLTEQSLASRHFKFWVGHTNFELGDGIQTGYKEFEKVIGQVPGVETVNLMTQYRFRIAIGKLFKDSDVMDSVRNTLLNFVEKIHGKK